MRAFKDICVPQKWRIYFTVVDPHWQPERSDVLLNKGTTKDKKTQRPYYELIKQIDLTYPALIHSVENESVFYVSLQILKLWMLNGEVSSTNHMTWRLLTELQQVRFVCWARPHLFNLNNATPTLFTPLGTAFWTYSTSTDDITRLHQFKNCFPVCCSVPTDTLWKIVCLFSKFKSSQKSLGVLFWHWAKL